MPRKARTVSAAAYALLELALTAGALGAAILARRHLPLPLVEPEFLEEPLGPLFLLTLGIWLPLVLRWGLSRTGRTESAFGSLWKVACIVGIGSILLFAAVFSVRGLAVSRSLLVRFFALDFLA